MQAVRKQDSNQEYCRKTWCSTNKKACQLKEFKQVRRRRENQSICKNVENQAIRKMHKHVARMPAIKETRKLAKPFKNAHNKKGG